MSQHKALVIGRNYCNILTTVRLLGQAGYKSSILKVHKTRPSRLKFLRTMKPDAYSRYVERYEELVGPKGPSDMERTIRAIAPKGALIIPVDDYSVYAVDEIFENLRRDYLMSSVKAIGGQINALMDKSIQKEEAGKLGINILKNWTVKSKGGAYEIPEGIIYPCFIKPNVSMASTKDKMRKCQSQEELAVALDKYAAEGDFDMLIEEFANIKQEYSLLGVATDSKVIAPGIFKATLGGHHERKGVAVTGITVSAREMPHMEEMVKGCCQLVKHLGYQGIFDIDLIETQDGKLFFVEINFRAGASIYAFRNGEKNLLGAFADYMFQGKPLDEKDYIFEEGLTFVSEKVLMEEYVRGDIDKKTFMSLMEKADTGFVKSDEDPGPFDDFKKYYLPADLLRLAYKVKG